MKFLWSLFSGETPVQESNPVPDFETHIKWPSDEIKEEVLIEEALRLADEDEAKMLARVSDTTSDGATAILNVNPATRVVSRVKSADVISNPDNFNEWPNELSDNSIIELDDTIMHQLSVNILQDRKNVFTVRNLRATIDKLNQDDKQRIMELWKFRKMWSNSHYIGFQERWIFIRSDNNTYITLEEMLKPDQAHYTEREDIRWKKIA